MKFLWKPAIFFTKQMEIGQTKAYGFTLGASMGYLNGVLMYAEAFKLKFSCPFNFTNFPFDSQRCCLNYYAQVENMKLNAANIIYDYGTTDNGPIVLNNLPFTLKLKLESQDFSEKIDPLLIKIVSYAGMCISMERKFPYFLLSSFYYPTASFALLSMISFLIKPDIVSTLLHQYHMDKDKDSFPKQKHRRNFFCNLPQKTPSRGLGGKYVVSCIPLPQKSH